MRLLWGILVCCVFGYKAQTKRCEGIIKDSLGPVAFAGVWCPETHTGVISNEQGVFQIQLPPESKSLQFRALGYALETRIIQDVPTCRLEIVLSQESVQLKEIEIFSGEDPAIGIIKKALSSRKENMDLTGTYSCNAYIKGSQKITSIPKNAAKLVALSKGAIRDTQSLKGTVYLSESVSEYYASNPDLEKEIMNSSKVSGNNRSFSFNNFSNMNVNFYKPFVRFGNITEQPIISPLNPQTFSFYKFYLKGSFTERGEKVYKIKVLPKSKTEACLYGYLYIHDSTWQVCGYDMVISKERQLQFADTLNLSCRYEWIPNHGVWMPQLEELRYNFQFFGFKGKGYFIAALSDYQMHPSFSNTFFKDAAIEIKKGSNMKDSLYWNKQRPVPLTIEEQTDYFKKDSIFKIENTARFIDSMDRKSNRMTALSLITGHTWKHRTRQVQYKISGLLEEGWQFNTVEGHKISTQCVRLWRDSSYREHETLLQLGYGWALQKLNIHASHQYVFNPIKNSSVKLQCHSGVQSFQPTVPFFNLQNSIYSLIVNQNYLKLYWSNHLRLVYETEWNNFCTFKGRLLLEQRKALFNQDFRVWVDWPNYSYFSNAPFHPGIETLGFETQMACIQDLEWTFRFKQRFILLPDLKINNGSPYPKIQIGIKTALPFSKNWAGFTFLKTSAWHTFSLNRWGKLQTRMEWGGFLNAQSVGLMDYKHFYTNMLLFQNLPLDGFRNIPYYELSTTKPYLQWHIEHHFKGFWLNKIPFLNTLHLQEVLGFHGLYIPGNPPLQQFVFGLEKIAKVIRLDASYTIQSASASGWGFTFGLVQPF